MIYPGLMLLAVRLRHLVWTALVWVLVVLAVVEANFAGSFWVLLVWTGICGWVVWRTVYVRGLKICVHGREVIYEGVFRRVRFAFADVEKLEIMMILDPRSSGTYVAHRIRNRRLARKLYGLGICMDDRHAALLEQVDNHCVAEDALGGWHINAVSEAVPKRGIPAEVLGAQRRFVWSGSWSAITGTEPLQLAQSLDPVLTSGDALLGQVVGDQPVAQAGTLCMHVDRGVDQVRIVPVTLEDRIREPLVVGLSGETQHPA